MTEKVTIIVFSGDLDKVLAAFNLALGAAAMEMKVTLFFTFWGLNVIRKDKKISRTRGIMRKILILVNRGGAKRLPLSRLNMGGLGRSMMKKLMEDSKIPSLEEMINMAQKMGVEFVACTTTMGMMGIFREDLIPEVGRLAGVGTYLGEATEGKINLFI
jgi:peroxiredoxin family protein